MVLFSGETDFWTIYSVAFGVYYTCIRYVHVCVHFIAGECGSQLLYAYIMYIYGTYVMCSRLDGRARCLHMDRILKLLSLSRPSRAQ